ncbi:PAS domain-containing sensor histidine kinase [Sulfitobacter sp. HNIBRBA3233]|uniref:PAS domain-containing sensor histidine kinase n=1 Tax=Sulfitobacter marinivivus TaxID=3158558 RepID=UPI0032DEA70B
MPHSQPSVREPSTAPVPVAEVPPPLLAPGIDKVVGLLPGFVYVFNHETQSNEYTNTSVAEYLGYSSEEIRAHGDRMMLRVIHPDDFAAVARHLGVIAGSCDQRHMALEYRVLTKDGRVRWLRSVDRVFDRTASGAVLRHVGYASDITVEKEATLRLADLNAKLEDTVAERTAELAALNESLEKMVVARTQELEQAAQELEELTYVATHDLKVPVNNLSRVSMCLLEAAQDVSPDIAEQIGWIGECADQLNKKIAGLVLVSQLRLGTAQPAEAIDVRSTLARLLRHHRARIRRRAGRIEIVRAERCSVQFASHELESILHSLMENAQHYAHSGRPLHIRITVETQGDKCLITIADNGTGLDPKRDQHKVFGLFKRAHVEPPGSGISLHCARRMLHRRGGDISLAAEPGNGAAFTLQLPMGNTS